MAKRNTQNEDQKDERTDRRAKRRSLSDLVGKDPDEALRRFLQTPKRKGEEDDADEESESEGDSSEEE